MKHTPDGAFVDIHNHVIPGVDDGAHDVEESKAALVAMWSAGVRALIATPHVDASLVRWPDRLSNRLAELDRGWSKLTSRVAPAAARLRLERGAEVKLDTPEPDLSDPRLRLAGGEFALVEFPYFAVPPRSEQVVALLGRSGWRPVIAHVERYRNLQAQYDVVGSWRDAGALLQLNGASLLGRYGPDARTAAYELLSRGWIDYVASDFHSRGKTRIEDYRALLLELGGVETADLLMQTNPERLLDGEPPMPVPPLTAARPIWKRIASIFR